MSFDALKEQVDSLPDGERRRLLAYLVSVEDSKSAGSVERLSRKIEDKTPEHWLTIDELDKKLGLNGAES